jgi:hypothetical protein
MTSFKHGFIWNLSPLYAAFDSWEIRKVVSIDYTIHAGNRIDEQEEDSAVVIEND